MNLEHVEKIAEAVLYEGYMLYPYRPSSVKNQQRWNFGVLYPPSWCDMQSGSDSSRMQTECLLKTDCIHATHRQGPLPADRAALRRQSSRTSSAASRTRNPISSSSIASKSRAASISPGRKPWNASFPYDASIPPIFAPWRHCSSLFPPEGSRISARRAGRRSQAQSSASGKLLTDPLRFDR